ncbi:MAG: NAD(P)/FAD-dependent oxidoreductase [Planctomycetaceae bacterium]|jgi:NADH dehydrogenase|nr:NAD(P)/FAD-dependent oxidoreductase [Planctomycetaceae bacterium]
MPNNRYKVAVIGAGFAGLSAAKELSKYDEFEICLIDRNNYHTFLPLLYQVAAAELESEDITSPLRGHFRKNRRVAVMHCRVAEIDHANKTLHTDGPDIRYDYLIMSMGSTTEFFGTPGAEKFAFTLKSLEDAVRLRSHILSCFEQASLYSDAHPTIYPNVSGQDKTDRQSALKHIIIIGGGPNGAEFAGALSELVRTSIYRDFPEFDRNSVQITLLEAAPNLLAGFPPLLAGYVRERLEKMDVTVKLNAAVTEIRKDGAVLKDGTFLPSETVVWTAGVRATDLAAETGFAAGKSGRIHVLPTLQIANRAEIFVAGDLSLPEGETVPPMVAPNAIQQGIHAARNLVRLVRKQELQPFVYHDKGSMAVVGRGAAAVRIGTRTLTGTIAWLVWLAVHLTYLVGFHNRLMVMFNWAWDYFVAERSVRLIFRSWKER